MRRWSGARVFTEVKKLTDILDACCESPIERLFADAFIEVGFKMGHTFTVNGGDAFALVIPDSALDAGRLMLRLQPEVGNYRPDFVVEYRPPRCSPLSVVVECDGHEWHDRTKEQAGRERTRQNWLTAEGYRILRFTGSQIYQDAHGCAVGVAKALRAFWADESKKATA